MRENSRGKLWLAAGIFFSYRKDRATVKCESLWLSYKRKPSGQGVHSHEGYYVAKATVLGAQRS